MALWNWHTTLFEQSKLTTRQSERTLLCEI
jgi:hypothetical protein